MSSSPSSSISHGVTRLTILVLASQLLMLSFAAAGNFHQDFDITFGDQRAKIMNGGQLLSLSLDQTSGSGFKSKNEYLFGRIDMQLKLVAGNSAGTVTAYYLTSQGSAHDEIDFEFLGNLTGDPYTLHTNVFAQGKGNKEQQFQLWFDPTKNFHTYSIIWNKHNIIFLVDNIPIREHKNEEARGVPFPMNQPMRIYSSLWEADDWPTRGGLVKIDWSKAPFRAFYRNFDASRACVWNQATSSSSCNGKSNNNIDEKTTTTIPLGGDQVLDAASRKKLRWVQKNHMVYNYCSDLRRFPQGVPVECRR